MAESLVPLHVLSPLSRCKSGRWNPSLNFFPSPTCLVVRHEPSRVRVTRCTWLLIDEDAGTLHGEPTRCLWPGTFASSLCAHIESKLHGYVVEMYLASLEAGAKPSTPHHCFQLVTASSFPCKGRALSRENVGSPHQLAYAKIVQNATACGRLDRTARMSILKGALGSMHLRTSQLELEKMD